ncbi:hypothetical protein [Priestia megaterium]
MCDSSPRGDHAGFVQVVDEKRLLIPERRGNHHRKRWICEYADASA